MSRAVGGRTEVIAVCESKSLLRGCGQPSVAVCQYCGRAFCEQHGAAHDDGQEICARKRCQRKRADLEEHFAYKEAVVARNRERRCGEPNCRDMGAGECSKCSGLFCRGHLEDAQIEQGRGLQTVLLHASLCRHCRRRRKLWRGR
jgi:hypothetical protein